MFSSSEWTRGDSRVPRGPKNAVVAACPLVLLALVLASCSRGPEREPSIGEAFAGPATLSLRKEIDPKSAVVGTAHHGDRLEITDQRRRWYKVRAPSGATGWTEDRDLLDTAQMNRLKELAKETAGLPSQGAATTFDTLNIHTEPNRLSASFLQVKEGEKFDVIAHRVLTKTPLPKRELVAPRPKTASAKKVKKSSGVAPPPRPAAPALPTDWVALSRERARVPEEDLPPAAKEDWTLVRTRDGQSGWVLTTRVYMSIPDEVAQYAEGHRIMSYFSLGSVQDGDQRKDTWLWTTAVGLGEDHDFDGYRIFSWNLRRHRYETTYIQRRERGYFPVLVKGSTFSVCLETPDGASRVRKEYSLDGHVVRVISQRPCAKSSEEGDQGETGESAHIEINGAPAGQAGMMESLKKRIKGLFGK